MGFGAIITKGEDNIPFDQGLMDWVVEVRVEQSLSSPTRFSIRFEADVCDSQPFFAYYKELQPGQIVAVLVPETSKKETEFKCLVRGPIGKVKTSLVLGGPGSWYQIEGEDRRVEMDRLCVEAKYTGKASDFVKPILQSYKFKPDVEKTKHEYKKDKTYNQNVSDLAMIRDLARKNNFDFWIEYELKEKISQATEGEKPIPIEEKALFKQSPPPPPPPKSLEEKAGTTIEDFVAYIGNLDEEPEKEIRVMVPEAKCPNTISFDLEVDVERASESFYSGVSDKTGKPDKGEAVDPEGKKNTGEDVKKVAGFKRTICKPAAGSSEDMQATKEAAIAEDGWFVKARVSTTHHMLNGVLMPQEWIYVKGIGVMHEGHFQVSEVDHVINNTGHFMDLTLRRNELNKHLWVFELEEFVSSSLEKVTSLF